MANIFVFGDLHLTDKPTASRRATGEDMETLSINLLKTALSYVLCNSCVILPGDVFDGVGVGFSLVLKAAAEFKRRAITPIIVLGQHDVPNRDFFSLNSPTKVFSALCNGMILQWSNPSKQVSCFEVWGMGFNDVTELSSVSKRNLTTSRSTGTILVAHGPISTQNLPFTSFSRVKDVLSTQNLKVFVVGDIHIPEVAFLDKTTNTLKHITNIVNPTRVSFPCLLNMGSLVRTNILEKNHPYQIALIRDDSVLIMPIDKERIQEAENRAPWKEKEEIPDIQSPEIKKALSQILADVTKDTVEFTSTELDKAIELAGISRAASEIIHKTLQYIRQRTGD